MAEVVDAGPSGATIRLAESAAPLQKRYPYAVQGMQVAAGDMVYAIKTSGTYVLLGGQITGTGEPGATFTPIVSDAGVISWTNNGGLPNPSPVNIKGPQGTRGSLIWTSSETWTSPDYTFPISGLSGPVGYTPLPGDIILRSWYRFTIDSVGVTTVHCTEWASIRGPEGPQGPKGDGMYAFEIRSDGHLWCLYDTAAAPAFSINSAGHLIYTIGGS